MQERNSTALSRHVERRFSAVGIKIGFRKRRRFITTGFGNENARRDLVSQSARRVAKCLSSEVAQIDNAVRLGPRDLAMLKGVNELCEILRYAQDDSVRENVDGIVTVFPDPHFQAVSESSHRRVKSFERI